MPGENLAIGFVDSGEVNEAWLESPAHKANIINNKYKEIGIAVLKGSFQGNTTTLVVQLFGSKMPVLDGKILTKTAETKNNQGSLASSPVESNAKKPGEAVMGAYDDASRFAPDDSFPYRLVSFFSNNFFAIMQDFIYGSLIFIILLLAANFALKADLQHKDLIFKAAGFLVLLAMFAMIDRNMVIQLIPHTFTIE